MDENQANNLTPNIDTTSWTLPSAEPVRMPEVGNVPMQFGAPTAKVADYTPAILGMVNSVRFDALNSVNRKASTDATMDKIFPGGNKLDLTTEVPLSQTHELLNDGETWLPKYTSYVPGVDNDARLSAQQTNFDKFLNPVKRFISNTSKAPLDIASFVYGVGDAAISGRFDALYDNSFSKYVDDLTTKTNFEYKNYYDKNQSNLGLNLYTWDKFGSGAEFTARMLASEALIAAATGGTSVPASLAKWGLKGALYTERAIEAGNIIRTGSKLSRMLRIATEPELAVAMQGKNVASTFSRMTGALETAANRGAWGDRLVQLRFATTSPMYEAGFEAMHFRKEAEQDFRDYFAQMGKDPTPEEINAFSAKMNGAADWVFGLNMGILSISNLAMFGDLLNIKNPLAKLGTSDALKANVFKIGTETGENGLKQAMKAGFWNKTAAYVKPFVQGALIEGVYEEGSQGIASNTLKNYVASSYNKDLMQKTGDYASAFSKAFNDQFSTKEGIEEIAIGALVGGLFGGVGGAIKTNREYNQQKSIAELQNRGQEFVNEYRTNAYTNEQLLSLFAHANRFQDLQEKMENAEATGNKFEQARLSAETFTSLLNAYHTVGKEAEFINMWSGMLTGMDNEMIAESTGLPIAEVDNFKSEQIKNMRDFSSNYSKGREAAQHMYKPNIGGFTEVDNNGVKTKVNTQNLIDAFSYAYGMSFFNEKFATETFDSFQTKLAQMTNNTDLVDKFGALGALQMADRVAVARYNDLNNQYNEVQEEFNKVADELNALNRSTEKEGVADKVLAKAKQLESIQNKISELANNKSLLWKSLIDNFYTKMNKVGYAPEMDLSTFTKQVSDIQTALNESSIDKADKLVLNQLLDQFSEANEAYRSYSNLVNRLGDPKYTYRTYRGIFSGTRARMDKSLNEHTKDVLLDIYGNLQDYNVALTNNITTPTETAVPEGTNIEDPISDTSEATNIDSNKVKLRTKQKELNDLLDGNYSQELQDKIDAIQEEIDNSEVENRARIEEVRRLNKEIQDLENEIKELEESKQIDEARKKRTVNANKSDYQQYEYIKPNGETIVGHLEINKGILQIVNSNEIVDIKEETVPLRNLNTSNIKGLTKVEEEDVIVEGNEVYVNGKLYKFNDFNDAVEVDDESNYTVTLKSRNGRSVKFTGSLADKIVYEHFLNLILESTNEQIAELNNQATTDRVLEEKYEELVAKTENRDSQESQIVRKNKPVQESIAKLKEIFSNIYFSNRNGAILDEGFAEFQNAMNLIEDRYLGLFQAHGMGKSIFGASVNDLINLFDRNIDPNRGGGMLYTTPLEGAKEASSALGASSAYSNGAFMLVAPAGTALTNIDDVVAILVNDGVVEENPEILNALREVFPNIIIDRYGNTNKVAKELAGNQGLIDEMEQARREEIDKIPLVPSVNQDNDPELQQRMDEYQARVDEINARYDEQINSLESNQNAEIQNRIDDLIAQERLQLEDEIAQIQGENAVEEKRQRLVNRINELKNQINSSNEIDNVDIRLLNQLDVELDMLNNQSTPFDPNDTYFNQLSWIINNIPRLNFENVEQLATISSPSQSDVEEYIGLIQENRNKSRIAELRDKLLPYNLADGLSLDGMNILDIIDLYNQAKRIKDINDLQQENLPETEFQKITKDVKDVETSSGYKAPNVGLNYDGAYIEQKNKNQNIYHIKLTSMLQKALDKGNNPEIIVYNEQGDKLQSIIVTPENLAQLGAAYDNARNIKVILSDDVYIRKPLNSTSFIVFGDILPILDLNAYAITGQPTSYNLIYDTNLDGTLSAKESEFDVTIDGNPVPFDKELLNSIRPGDTVTLEFDRNDDYNKTLTEQEYVAKGNIYIKKNGKLLNILKATDFQNKSVSENWNNLEATRRNVIKASNQNKTVELTVSNSYIGLPIINLNQDGTAIEVPLDESKVVAYGYVDENGELQGDIARTKIDNSQYLTPLYSYGYRTPVIAFKAYGKVFAFPINIKPKTTNVSSDLDNILNDPTLNREQRIFEINNLLELNGLLTNDIALSNVNFDTEKAREALSAIQQKVDITNPQEYMDAEKTAFIDLNNPFMSSKLVLNLISSENELNDIKIETDITLGNQNPNVDISTMDFKGRNASEDKIC